MYMKNDAAREIKKKGGNNMEPTWRAGLMMNWNPKSLHIHPPTMIDDDDSTGGGEIYFIFLSISNTSLIYIYA